MGIIASGLSGMLRRDDQAAAAVVRLTAAVEHIAGELFGRLNQAEQRLATLEAKLS